MITYKKIPWSLVKFFQLILEEIYDIILRNLYEDIRHFVWGYSPICMRIFSTLCEDIRHFVWRYSPLCMRIFASLYEDIRQFVWRYSPLCMRIFATLKTRRKLGQVSFRKLKTSGIITGKVLFSYLPICFPCPQYQKQSQKSFVKLTQPMRNDVMNMPGAWDKDKIWVELSLWPSVL